MTSATKRGVWRSLTSVWVGLISGVCAFALLVTSTATWAAEPSPSPSASPSPEVSPTPEPIPDPTPEPSPSPSPGDDPDIDDPGVVTIDGNELLDQAPVVPVESRRVGSVDPAENDADDGVFEASEGVLPRATTEFFVVDSRAGLEEKILGRQASPGGVPGSIVVGVAESPIDDQVQDVLDFLRKIDLIGALGRSDMVQSKHRQVDAGSEVQVEVIPGFGDEGGVPGSAFAARVSPTDVGDTGWVEVAFDTSGFQNAYGGDYGDRLMFIMLPECALTTPEEPGCLEGAPVTFTRGVDGVMRVLVPVETAAMSSIEMPERGNGGNTSDRSAGAGGGGGPLGSTLVSMETQPGGTIIAAVSGADSQSGTFKATDLAPRGTWGVSEPTGAFTYSIPIEVPPVEVGPVPSVVLSYSSQTVDGKSIATNSQAGIVGEGWTMPVSYIERLYKPCKDDGGSTPEMCWASPYTDKPDEAIYALSLNGMTEELVWVKTEGNEATYQAASDPTLKITRYFGASGRSGNGDNDGEYFEVMTSDGSVYYFGYGVTQGSETSDSVATVPVWGNQAGEPGWSGSQGIVQNQGYRFMLDLVVDVNDNAMSYFYYTPDTPNKYTNGSTYTYVRDIQLKRIDYGQTWTPAPAPGVLSAPQAKVELDLVERCVEYGQFFDPLPTGADINTLCADVSTSTAASYPDVPADLICTGTSCLSSQNSPVFFSTVRLNQINTSVKVGESWVPVDTTQLISAFPTTNDGSARSLWLDSVYTYAYGDESGETAEERTLDDRQTYLTKFSGKRLNNRVDWDMTPGYTLYTPQRALDRMRISSVLTDMGGRIDVTYATPTAGTLNASGVPEGTLCPQGGADSAGYATWNATHTVNSATNNQLCYAVKRGTTTEIFHNYVVTKVDLVDAVADTPTMTHLYEYGGTPAYGFADSVLYAPGTGDATYSSYRGFETVSSMMAPDSMRNTAGEVVRVDPSRFRVGDFNGDGVADLFTSDENGQWSYYASGVGDPVDLWGDENVPLEDLRFEDFDGDGITDVYTQPGTGGKYSPGGAVAWVSRNTTTLALSDHRFGDFNGDGSTDIFYRAPAGTWHYLSGGTGSWINIAGDSATPLSNLRFGDFDGDGKTDVFAYRSATDWRYSSGGAVTYTILPSYPTIALADLRFEDFDGDGKTDIMTLKADGSWEYSSGATGPWAPIDEVVDMGVDLDDLALSDLNGDGRADVLNIDNGDWQYSSAGVTGFFDLAADTGLTLSDIRFGDFNGDGEQDIFAFDTDYTWVYSPSASGEWVDLYDGDTTTPLADLRFGDFDGDGTTDVFMKDASNQCKYSPGGAEAYENLALTTAALSDMGFGDFNADGKTDIFWRNPSDGHWYYLPGGLYSSWLSLAADSATPISNLRFEDFDGDGKTDVFAYRSASDWRYSSGGAVGYTYLHADSTVALEDLRLGDLNGDGYTDIFTQDSNGAWKYSSKGTADWSYLGDVADMGVALSNLGFGDFNGDGRTDVFTVTDGDWQYSSAGVTGFFDLAADTGLTLSDIEFGDFNGDGEQDVFAFDTDHTWMYSPSASGEWIDLYDGDTTTPLEDLRFGDFNGDGITDVFTSVPGQQKYSPGGASEYVYLSDSGVALDDFRFGDFNGDGKTDVFHRQTSTGKLLYLYEGHTAWIYISGTGAPVENLRFGDFNGDGKTDVFSWWDGGIWNYLYEGHPDWIGLAGDSSTPLSDLRFGDFDADGYTDVFTQDANGAWKISSKGTADWSYLDKPSMGVASTELKFGNFDDDEDGTTDIFVTDSLGRGRYALSGSGDWVFLTHPDAVVTTNQYYRGTIGNKLTSLYDGSTLTDDPRLSGRVASSQTTIPGESGGAEVVAASQPTYDSTPTGAVPDWKFGPVSITHSPHTVLTPSSVSTSFDGDWSVTSESSTVYDKITSEFETTLFLPVESQTVVTSRTGTIIDETETQRSTTTYVQGDPESETKAYLVLPSVVESFYWIDDEWVLTGRSETWYDTVPGDWSGVNIPTRGLPTAERSYTTATAHVDAYAAYDEDDGRIVAAWMPATPPENLGTAEKPADWTNESASWAYTTEDDLWKATVTRPLGQVSSTWVEPTRGNVVKQKGPNDKDWTHYQYDALGLLVAGWAPAQWGEADSPVMAPVQPEPPATPIDPDIPTVLYVYDVYANGPSLRTTPVTVISAQFVADTAPNTPAGEERFQGFDSTETTRRSYTFLDGWGRAVEQHTPAADGKRYLDGVEDPNGLPGRTVTATYYNSLGQVEWTSAPFFNNEAPAQIASGLVSPETEDLSSYTLNTYDDLGRTVETALMGIVDIEGTPTTDTEVTSTETAYAGPVTMTLGPDGSGTVAETDVLGRLKEQSQCATLTLSTGECTDPITTAYDYHTYDVDAVSPDLSGAEEGFSKVTVTDAEDNDTVFVSNLAGRRTYMSDPNSGDTTYEYDENGQTTWVTSATGDIRMGYDDLGRMTMRRAFSDYDTEVPGESDWKTVETWESETLWTYVNQEGDDPIGALKTTTSTSMIEVGETPATAEPFTVTSTIDDFDDYGRPLETTLTLPESADGTTRLGDLSGYEYTTSVTYDDTTTGKPQTGVVTGTTLPAIGGLPAETVSTGYRLNGMAQTLTLEDSASTPTWSMELVSGVTVDGTGQFTQREYGNGVTRDVVWDTVRRVPTSLSASFDTDGLGEGTDRTLLQYDTLVHDDAGRVTSIVDDRPSAEGSRQCYAYDGHNRLSAAWTWDEACGSAAPVEFDTDWDLADGVSYATTWEYSAAGRITEIVNLASGTGVEVSDGFTYGGETGPVSAVTSVDDGTIEDTFEYDGAGRMDSRTVDGDTTILTWDVLSNLVKTVETGGDTFLYVYDGSGQRVVKINVTQDAATAYLGSTEVTDLDTTTNHTTDIELESTSFVTGTRFYMFGGATVAVREATPAASTLSLLLGDMQGSAQVMMKVDPDAQSPTGLEEASSTIVNLETDVTRSAYMPYGAVRGDDNLSIDHGWLNQVTDETDTGLVYLNARYYDPVLSRFLSPDPLVSISNPETLDPYAYGYNNPVLYSDASGMCGGFWGFVTRIFSPDGWNNCATSTKLPGVARVPTAEGGAELVQGIGAGLDDLAGQTVHAFSVDGIAENYRAWGEDRNERGYISGTWHFMVEDPLKEAADGLEQSFDDFMRGNYFDAGREAVAPTVTIGLIAVSLTGLGTLFSKALRGIVSRLDRTMAEINSARWNPANLERPPNNGGILGTETPAIAQPGATLVQYGNGKSPYITFSNTPPYMVSLPVTNTKVLSTYQVIRPIQGDLSRATPWWGQMGQGWQMTLPKKVNRLVRGSKPYLRQID